jgi:hypothetical protein
MTVSRGGFRFPARCAAGGCILNDTAGAHATGEHMGLEGARWPVALGDAWRWAEAEEAKPHRCGRPDEGDWLAGHGVDEDGDCDAPWVCPECLRAHDLIRSHCGECGRPEGWYWREAFEEHEAGGFPWQWPRTVTVTEDYLGILAVSADEGVQTTAEIVASGGWCAPSETVGDL